MTRAAILDDRAFLSRMGWWPPAPRAIDPVGWIANFDGADRNLASHLLDSFQFFNKETTDELVLAAIDEAASLVHASSELACDDFPENALISFPTGETPNVTDSGFAMVRKLRQLLPIREANCLSPDSAVRQLAVSDKVLILVDDFVGSGQQFRETWTRRYQLGSSLEMSLMDAASGSQIFYCVAIITDYGRQRIAALDPRIKVCAGYSLSSRYSITDPATHLVPSGRQAETMALIAKYSTRCGIPQDQSLGFHRLGLAIAFEHGTPDATLPLFFHEGPGWSSLVKRR
ncbi:phosphoribosyltransferase-like protein [Phycicoccus sonneratiae]|uniref:PRTase-CE domain-containing protein n=1 Tax=Phycicoccus sonneratiae TaxID=2807628 RepID=A0ABS2CQ97_9MICO|nr:hypothetical protein [Phycicoccus sonneraticus]MBM6402046.1 hypothetical protein [Phycicoccus sonneraticus]